MTLSMRWINSAGGPLVLLPTSMQRQWRGALGGAEDVPSDYALATTVEDYVGVVTKNARQILVFNDEPLQTTAFYLRDRPYLARWHHAPSAAIAEQVLATMQPSQLTRLQAVDFQIEEPSMVLADAGAPGERMSENDSLPIHIRPGKYRVQVNEYSPNKETRFHVVEFVPKSSDD